MVNRFNQHIEEMNKKFLTILILIGLSLILIPTIALAGYEDFTSYQELDPNGRISTTTTRASANELQLGPDDARLYYDKGINYFSGDFEHWLDVRQATGTAGVPMIYWAVANDLDDEKGLRTANKSYLSAMVLDPGGGDPNQRFYIHEHDGASGYETYWDDSVINTTRYLKIKRDETIGTYGTLYCYIYSDSARTDLLATLTLTLHTSTKDFRYLYGVNNYNDGNYPTLVITAYVEYMDLEGAAPPVVAPPQTRIIIIE